MQTLVTVAPLTALGLWVAAVLPGVTPTGLWREELVLPTVAVLAPTVLTAVRYRRAGSSATRRVRGRTQRRAQRITAQAAALALCLLGLNEARSQGFSPAGRIDVLTSSAPLLAALLAALVVLAVGPPLLGLLVWLSAGRRGALGLLALARMARMPGTAAVTVFILTLVLATADIAVALHGTAGKEGAAAGARAATRIAAAPGDGIPSSALNSALPGLDPLEASTADYLTLLAALAVAAGCLVVALAAAGDAVERRATVARLATMGLTAGRPARSPPCELLGPIALAAAGGTAAVAAAAVDRAPGPGPGPRRRKRADHSRDPGPAGLGGGRPCSPWRPGWPPPPPPAAAPPAPSASATRQKEPDREPHRPWENTVTLRDAGEPAIECTLAGAHLPHRKLEVQALQGLDLRVEPRRVHRAGRAPPAAASPRCWASCPASTRPRPGRCGWPAGNWPG